MSGSSRCLGPTGTVLFVYGITQVGWFEAAGDGVCGKIWHSC